MSDMVQLPPVDPSIDVSVVIVSHNSEEVLRECLSSVYNAAPGLHLEVFVVDKTS